MSGGGTERDDACRNAFSVWICTGKAASHEFRVWD